MRRMIMRLAFTLCVASAVALPGVSASANGVSQASLTSAKDSGEPYGTHPPTLSIHRPKPGKPVQITSGGFRPGRPCRIIIHSAPVELGTAMADANGIVTATVTIPSDFAPGAKHTIEIAGEGSDGAPVSDTVEVTLAGGSSSMTSTDHIAEAAGAAVVVVLLGGFFLFLIRRRRVAADS